MESKSSAAVYYNNCEGNKHASDWVHLFCWQTSWWILFSGTFWGAIAEEIAAAEPPTGFQGALSIHHWSVASFYDCQFWFSFASCFDSYAGLISWLFPPAIAAGVYFNVPVILNVNNSHLSITINEERFNLQINWLLFLDINSAYAILIYFEEEVILNSNSYISFRGSTYTLEQVYLQSYFALLRWINPINPTTLNLRYTIWRGELETSW